MSYSVKLYDASGGVVETQTITRTDLVAIADAVRSGVASPINVRVVKQILTAERPNVAKLELYSDGRLIATV